MTFIDDLKLTLEQRFDLLDLACDSAVPGTSGFDEACGRYEECKAILDLVNLAPRPFRCGYCDCECGTNEAAYDDKPGNCGCGQSEFCGAVYPDEQARAEIDAHLNRTQAFVDHNEQLAEATIVQQAAKLDCYHVLKDAGLPIPSDLKAECEQPHCI